MEGTLANPPGVSSCAVCGSPDCRQFHNAPYPKNYPFMWDRALQGSPGGHIPRDALDVPPPRAGGARKNRGLRCL